MNANSRSTVAVVGAGLMGGAMVQRLCALGWPVVACDIDPVRRAQARDAGALLALTPHAAARALGPSGALIVVVVDAVQCDEVLWGNDGAAEALRPGHTVMLCPTIAPQDTVRIAARLAMQGVHALDAPMSGGPARAREGRMSLMLAGPDAVVARHAPLLADLSDQVFRVGERVGDGARTKLVNNLLAGIQLAGAAEALALAERMGLDLATTLNVIEHASGQSWIGSDRMRRQIAGDPTPHAHMTLLAKDTRLAVAAANSVGQGGALGPVAAGVFAAAVADGLARHDDGALLDWMRAHPGGLADR